MWESQGQASAVLAASAAVYDDPRMGLLAATLFRGMPRMMWMPNCKPRAWTRSARGLNPCVPVADGNRLVDGRYRPLASMSCSPSYQR